jgi:tetratricopeptide (TPR) repeat protein
MFRATAATAMTLLLMLLIATTYASVRAVRQQNRAEHQADLARASEKTAQEQRGIAVRASGVATAAAAAEREQRKKADESRIIANRQRDVALEALTTLIFDAQDQLNAVPNSRQVRKQLLTTAAAKLENVDVNSPEVSLKVRTDGAIAFVKLADNMSQLGDSAEARRFYRRALGRFSVLLAERPTDWKLRNSVWLATSKLADAEATVFDFEPAKRHYREALTMIEQMSREEPNREDWAYPGFVDRLLVVSGTIA